MLVTQILALPIHAVRSNYLLIKVAGLFPLPLSSLFFPYSRLAITKKLSSSCLIRLLLMHFHMRTVICYLAQDSNHSCSAPMRSATSRYTLNFLICVLRLEFRTYHSCPTYLPSVGL